VRWTRHPETAPQRFDETDPEPMTEHELDLTAPSETELAERKLMMARAEKYRERKFERRLVAPAYEGR
jgi:hypothetical protein